MTTADASDVSERRLPASPRSAARCCCPADRRARGTRLRSGTNAGRTWASSCWTACCYETWSSLGARCRAPRSGGPPAAVGRRNRGPLDQPADQLDRARADAARLAGRGLCLERRRMDGDHLHPHGAGDPRRARLLSFRLAILELRHVDLRVLFLLWHLADRWGQVSGEGIRPEPRPDARDHRPGGRGTPEIGDARAPETRGGGGSLAPGTPWCCSGRRRRKSATGPGRTDPPHGSIRSGAARNGRGTQHHRRSRLPRRRGRDASRSRARS
jgi:hypothetical protein